MEAVAGFLERVNGYLWGPPMLVLLFGTHLYFTHRLRFIQRFTSLGIRLSVDKSKNCAGDVSQFGALTTALAATYARIPEAIVLILRSAFTGQAAAGGFAGATVMIAARYGVATGLFSNESGLGSVPIEAAAAQTRNPVRQALVSSTGMFWDTVIVCAMTGLVIVNSGVWQMKSVGHQGNHLTTAAFAQVQRTRKWCGISLTPRTP